MLDCHCQLRLLDIGYKEAYMAWVLRVTELLEWRTNEAEVSFEVDEVCKEQKGFGREVEFHINDDIASALFCWGQGPNRKQQHSPLEGGYPGGQCEQHLAPEGREVGEVGEVGVQPRLSKVPFHSLL